MCTVLTYAKNNFKLVGRNLDVDRRYGESFITVSRGERLHLRSGDTLTMRESVRGMGVYIDGYPMLFDAVNESGLFIAGLNFVGSAAFLDPVAGKCALAPYELIPYLLSECRSTEDAEELLSNTVLTNTPFNEFVPPARLHYFITDGRSSITFEQTEDGGRIYKNKIGVLTNDPPFPYHLANLANYRTLSTYQGECRFAPELEIPTYCLGMGAVGIPGDSSSPSRFVRAAFLSNNASASTETEARAVAFHILESVGMIPGTVKTEDGERDERTDYSAVVDLKSRKYYVRKYGSLDISVY